MIPRPDAAGHAGRRDQEEGAWWRGRHGALAETGQGRFPRLAPFLRGDEHPERTSHKGGKRMHMKAQNQGRRETEVAKSLSVRTRCS